MPVQVVVDFPTNVQQFDVLGYDSDTVPTFVGHTALCGVAVQKGMSSATASRTTHMTPPFLVNGPSQVCNYHARIIFQDEEREQVRAFVDQLESEYKAERLRFAAIQGWDDNAKSQFRKNQYVILPHVRPPDADRPYYQFSCAGFVYESFAQVGINLVALDRITLSSLGVLKTAYAHSAHYLEDPDFRVAMGLVGEGPWPVLLPGHIINSAARTCIEIIAEPYCPAAGSECYPPRTSTPDLSAGQDSDSGIQDDADQGTH